MAQPSSTGSELCQLLSLSPSLDEIILAYNFESYGGNIQPFTLQEAQRRCNFEADAVLVFLSVLCPINAAAIFPIDIRYDPAFDLLHNMKRAHVTTMDLWGNMETFHMLSPSVIGRVPMVFPYGFGN